MHIRSGTVNDLDFLKRMLFEAFFWNPAFERPDMDEFFRIPEFVKLTAEWGRPGDYMVIAESARVTLGAAWYRSWTEEHHSYGFVDPAIPELGIGVLFDHRSRGIGRLLLQNLINTAAESGYKALSLSVDPGNFARMLYEAEGFVKVDVSGTSWTYTLIL